MMQRGSRLLTMMAVALLVVPITYAVADRSSSKPSAQELERFAMKQTRKQAVRTCRVIPRKVLTKSFDVQSATNNYIALGYARDIDISDTTSTSRLQRLRQGSSTG